MLMGAQSHVLYHLRHHRTDRYRLLPIVARRLDHPLHLLVCLRFIRLVLYLKLTRSSQLLQCLLARVLNLMMRRPTAPNILQRRCLGLRRPCLLVRQHLRFLVLEIFQEKSRHGHLSLRRTSAHPTSTMSQCQRHRKNAQVDRRHLYPATAGQPRPARHLRHRRRKLRPADMIRWTSVTMTTKVPITMGITILTLRQVQSIKTL